MLEEDFADTIGCERAILVGVECLLVLDECSGKVALGDLLLATQNRDADGEIRRAFKDPVLGIDADAPGAAEGFYRESGFCSGDIDAADLGFAVGFDAELNGHAKEIEILIDGADGAEALVISEAIDSVFVGKGWGAGSVEPLSEEWTELELGLGLGDGLNVGAANGLVGVLGEQAAKEFDEYIVAHLPPQHMEDHGTFFESHGLELWREWVEPTESGEGFGIVGEGSGGDVGDGGLEGSFSGGVFEVHQFGIARHAVRDPCVVEGGGGYLAAPPLVGESVGEQALAVVVDDAVPCDGDDLWGPCGGYGVFGELYDVDATGFGLTEGVGHELELAGGLANEVEGSGFALFGDVNAHVVDAGSGDGVEELARDDGAGEAGLGPVEGVLGAIAGQAFGRARTAAADDTLVGGDADVHLCGEAIGEEPGHGEPATGVEQDGDGVGYRSEFNTFDGAGVGAGEGAGVLEVVRGGGAFGEGGGERDADGGVVGESLGLEGFAGGVGKLGELEAVVELEGGRGEIFQGGEGDGHGG